MQRKLEKLKPEKGKKTSSNLQKATTENQPKDPTLITQGIKMHL